MPPVTGSSSGRCRQARRTLVRQSITASRRAPRPSRRMDGPDPTVPGLHRDLRRAVPSGVAGTPSGVAGTVRGLRLGCKRPMGQVLGEREGGEGDERRGQQAGLERPELGLLVVVDERLRWWPRRARPPARPPRSRSEATKSMPGSDGDADLGRDLGADPLVRLDLGRRTCSVRPASTIAPMRATPSEEPSCWPVYWRPPASPRPEASTDDCTTLPSWDAMSPIPTPSTAIDTAKRDVRQVGLDGGEQGERRPGR